MPNLVSISNAAHKNLRVNQAQSLIQQSDTHLVPVVIDEFSRLSAQYPLAFVKHEETGKFVCVALMGLKEGENLFIDDGRLTSFCLPLNLSRQPLFLGLSDSGAQEDTVVCIDMDHPSVNETEGKRLFDDNGEQTEMLQDMCSILATLYQGEQKTEVFIEQLLSEDLLAPITLDITFDDQSKSQINGLYSIDEDKLAELSAESLVAMHQNKSLAAAYTMLVSLGQIQSMIHQKNKVLSDS